MTERVLDALKAIDLALTAKKTKTIRRKASEDDSSLNVIEIDDKFVEVLSDIGSHRYLGKQLSVSSSSQAIISVFNRKRSAWTSFFKYKKKYLS